MQQAVDVVVVSYNSRDELRACVEPLAGERDVNVTVVDNASTDGCLDTVRDLPVQIVALSENNGFAHGCNVGWRASSAPYVLFLNPDARIDIESIRALSAVLERDPSVGAAAPVIVDDAGRLDYSVRRFPRLRSTFAQALFLHRLFPRAPWGDELVRDPESYTAPHDVEWVSGASILVRRSTLEQLGGWDEGFFLYCEDVDLCKRIRDKGMRVEFWPRARVVHIGGASAPRPSLFPTLAASRVRYASKHRARAAAFAERMGIALGALTHMVVGRSAAARAAHGRAFAVALGLTDAKRP